MKVRVQRPNYGAEEVQLEEGATIQDALDACDLDHSGTTVTREGEQVNTSDPVQDGDLFTLVPKVEGGVGKVKVLRMNEGEEEVDLADASTVGDALVEAGLSYHQCAVYHNSQQADFEDTVSSGDTLIISPNVEGGREFLVC